MKKTPKVFSRGVPEEPEPPKPSDDEMLRAWAAIPLDADVWVAFAAAGAEIGAAHDDWSLHKVGWALDKNHTPERDRQLIDLCERAIASPHCEYRSTHWRPLLIKAYARVGRIDDARREIVAVVAHAVSYDSSNWTAIIAYLDAIGRRADADAIFHAATRYVSHFDLEREVAKSSRGTKQHAAQVLLDLTAPLFANLDAVDDVTLFGVESLFQYMVRDGALGNAVLPSAARARAEREARANRREAEAWRRLFKGDPLDSLGPKELERLLTVNPAKLTVEQADRLTRAAAAAHSPPNTMPREVGVASAMSSATKLAHLQLSSRLEEFALKACGLNMPVALVAYEAMFAVPPPKGVARWSWLQSANNALITTHAEKLYVASAELADRVVQYARENLHIAHSAARSYVAVGRYDDAFAQVKLAVELNYEHLAKLRVDTDLGPLLERADFKALFAEKTR